MQTIDGKAGTSRDAPDLDRMTTVRAFLLFLFLDIGFGLFGFERVNRFLMRSRPRRDPANPSWGRERALATFEAVQKATMFYYRKRKDCLPKALTTFHLLRRQGLAASLCYGVKKFPFEAHTWVESQGEILDDFPARVTRYRVIHRVSA
ncbi:MAG: lasso peptide biosynthesis B2 protein [Thermoanaerobaculia bacterium]